MKSSKITSVQTFVCESTKTGMPSGFVYVNFNKVLNINTLIKDWSHSKNWWFSSNLKIHTSRWKKYPDGYTLIVKYRSPSHSSYIEVITLDFEGLENPLKITYEK
jgi:hypothetical protein